MKLSYKRNSLRACMLVKYISYIEEIWEHFTKKKIQRVSYLKNKAQYKIKEFTLRLGSLVLVKNLAIELSVDKKMKSQYLGPIIVIRQLKRETFILAELDSLVWQNKVVAFRVIPYLAHRTIVFRSEV